jgi:CubicO group peptidase (beta-lactamase class C family)
LWNYSNSGYVLLSYLLEEVTGEAYADFLRQNIFTPLGMKDSGYDSNAAVSAHRASGYTFDGRRLQNAEYVDLTVPQGAGGFYSITEDLLKWEQGLFGGKVLKPESLAKMTTPFKNNCAFGLELQTSAGRKVIEQGGANR